jgi:hypothetical protein
VLGPSNPFPIGAVNREGTSQAKSYYDNILRILALICIDNTKDSVQLYCNQKFLNIDIVARI